MKYTFAKCTLGCWYLIPESKKADFYSAVANNARGYITRHFGKYRVDHPCHVIFENPEEV